MHVLRPTELAEVWLGVEWLDGHLAHQAACPFHSYHDAHCNKKVAHLDDALGGMVEVLTVYGCAYLRLIRLRIARLVVITALVEPQYLHLTVEAYLQLGVYQSLAGSPIPKALDARFAKSSSISSSPILR